MTNYEELTALVKRSVDAFNALPANEQEHMLQEQRASWVRGEIGMGSDADEPKTRAATQPAPPVANAEREPVAAFRYVISDGHSEWLCREPLEPEAKRDGVYRCPPAPPAIESGEVERLRADLARKDEALDHARQFIEDEYRDERAIALEGEFLDRRARLIHSVIVASLALTKSEG